MQEKRLSRIPNSLLTSFGRWFPASSGVWQTFIVVTVLAILENVGIIHDDHGFWLLFWLTVYSAVTQPVLGYVNRLDTARADAAVSEMREILAQMRELMVSIQAQESEELEILRSNPQNRPENAQEGSS